MIEYRVRSEARTSYADGDGRQQREQQRVGSCGGKTATGWWRKTHGADTSKFFFYFDFFHSYCKVI